MSAALAIPAANTPLSAENLGAIAEARRRAKAIRRTMSTAKVNGGTAAVFGAMALLGGIFGLPALLLGIGMCAAAWNEFRLAKGVQRLEVAALRGLALNQVVLVGAVWVYCGFNIVAALRGGGPLAEAAGGDPAMAEVMAPIAGLAQTIALGMYGGTAFVVAVSQGLLALYYLSRRKHVEAYLARTPEWIADLQRRGDLA